MRFYLSLILSFFLINLYSAATVSSDKYIEELEVVGVQPGPKMWVLTNGERELWVLGSLSPLPKKFDWDSSSVEAILADSDVFIPTPGLSLTADFKGTLSMLPVLRGLKNNPGKKRLHEVLPSDLYKRWQKQKDIYLKKDKKIEKKRPVFAAEQLFEKAIKKNGLVGDKKIWKVINKNVKKNKMEVWDVGFHAKLEEPRKTLKAFKKSEIEDFECFEKTITRLENDMTTIAKRAEAWAAGDVKKLRVLRFEDQSLSCALSIAASGFAKEKGLEVTPEKMKQRWLEAAVKALETKKVSFSVLPIDGLLSENSWLTALESLGYALEGP